VEKYRAVILWNVWIEKLKFKGNKQSGTYVLKEGRAA
jgi:hypothetical protein